MIKTIFDFREGYTYVKTFCDGLMHANYNTIRFLISYYYLFTAIFATVPLLKVKKYQKCVLGGISATILAEFLVFLASGEIYTHPALHITLITIMSFIMYVRIIQFFVGIASWAFLLSCILTITFRKSVMGASPFLFILGIFFEFSASEISPSFFMNRVLVLTLGIAMIVVQNMQIQSLTNLNIAILPCILIGSMILNYFVEMLVVPALKERRRRQRLTQKNAV